MPFLVTDSGVTKTISAPHDCNNNATILGLSLISMSCDGVKGGVLGNTDRQDLWPFWEESPSWKPHREVSTHTTMILERLQQIGTIRVMGNEALDDPSWSRDVDRVLFTGSIRNMPSQIELLIEEGDLFVRPFGGEVPAEAPEEGMARQGMV